MHASVRLLLSLRKKDLTELTFDLGDVARFPTKKITRNSASFQIPLFRFLFVFFLNAIFNSTQFNSISRFDNRDRTILIQLKVVHNQV